MVSQGSLVSVSLCHSGGQIPLHLVDGGPGCCHMTQNAQDSPSQKSDRPEISTGLGLGNLLPPRPCRRPPFKPASLLAPGIGTPSTLRLGGKVMATFLKVSRASPLAVEPDQLRGSSSFISPGGLDVGRQCWERHVVPIIQMGFSSENPLSLNFKHLDQY